MSAASLRRLLGNLREHDIYLYGHTGQVTQPTIFRLICAAGWFNSAGPEQKPAARQCAACGRAAVPAAGCRFRRLPSHRPSVVERVWSGLGTDAPSEEESLRLAREELTAVRAAARDRQASQVPPPEIIVDPNVWVSALISPGGTTAGVLRAVLSDEVTAIVTPHLLEELSAVLERDQFRRWAGLADARAFVAALSDKADLRPDAGKPRRSARDPDDDYLVALAEETGAVIVTGDDDLLSRNLTPPALTPRALLDLLESLG